MSKLGAALRSGTGVLGGLLDRILPDEQGRVRYHYVLVDYLCRVESGRLQAASDAAETRWVERSRLAEHGLRPETMRVIERAFALEMQPQRHGDTKKKNSGVRSQKPE